MPTPSGFSSSAPPVDAGAWRRVTIRDARTGRRLRLTHPAGEPRWATWLGDEASATWARLTQVHAGKGTTVWRGTLEDGGPVFYFKTFAWRGPGDRWKELLRAPRALRAWRRAWEADALGFQVIRPVCLLTGRRGTGGPRDLLVTRETVDAEPLRAWLRANQPAGTRRRVLDALGREVARWHAAGLAHADLNLDNLLLRWQAGQPGFVWLDLEGSRFHRRGVPLRARARDLGDLNYERQALTLEERVRAWRAYRRAARLAAPTARRLRAEVVARTRHRWRKRGWLP